MQHNGHVVVVSNSTRVKGGMRNGGQAGGMYGSGGGGGLNPVSPAYPGFAGAGGAAGGLASPQHNAYAPPPHRGLLPCVHTALLLYCAVVLCIMPIA